MDELIIESPNDTGSMDNESNEDFLIYASSNQSQLKELIYLQKAEIYIDCGVLIILLAILFFNGFYQMRS